MEIDGDWKVRYSATQEQPFDSEEGDSEEVATISLNDSIFDPVLLQSRDQLTKFI